MLTAKTIASEAGRVARTWTTTGLAWGVVGGGALLYALEFTPVWKQLPVAQKVYPYPKDTPEESDE